MHRTAQWYKRLPEKHCMYFFVWCYFSFYPIRSSQHFMLRFMLIKGSKIEIRSGSDRKTKSRSTYLRPNITSATTIDLISAWYLFLPLFIGTNYMSITRVWTILIINVRYFSHPNSLCTYSELLPFPTTTSTLNPSSHSQSLTITITTTWYAPCVLWIRIKMIFFTLM